MSHPALPALLAGCEHVYSDVELAHKLNRAERENRQLRIKLGMDPTAPDIHLGHCVVLAKMRQFQDLGHKAVLIIGDFTASIGDPTGRSKTRPVLNEAQIEANAQTYLAQAGRVLDTSPEKLEVRHNSEWLGRMNFADVIKLAARMTVGQMLKRDDFRKRYESETPISVHELLYPLAQGWDSVNIHADLELGGTDQTYNNLVGRDLQIDAGQEPQVVMIMPILRGTDGVKKMSKSLGNYIGVNDPPRDVFGKTMSIPDELLDEWFRLATSVPEHEWRAAIADHPMRAKALLARRIGERFYPAAEMAAAEEWWRARFGGGKGRKAVGAGSGAGGGLPGTGSGAVTGLAGTGSGAVTGLAGAGSGAVSGLAGASGSGADVADGSGFGGGSAIGAGSSDGTGSAADERVRVRIPPEELNPDGTIAAWKLYWLAHEREISKSEARRMVEGGAFELLSLSEHKAPAPALSEHEAQASASSEHEAPAPALSEHNAPAPALSEHEAPASAPKHNAPAPALSEHEAPASASKHDAPAPASSEHEAPASAAFGRITDPNRAIKPTLGIEFRAGRYRKGERVKQPLIAVIAAQQGE